LLPVPKLHYSIVFGRKQLVPGTFMLKMEIFVQAQSSGAASPFICVSNNSNTSQ